MKTLHYKGFMVRQEGGNYYAQDGCNFDQFLNGRTNIIENPVGVCFLFATLTSVKQAIDRYQNIRLDDPIFHGRWRNSPEMNIVD